MLVLEVDTRLVDDTLEFSGVYRYLANLLHQL